MYDIIIVGAGPAGLTSSIYSARSGKKVLVIEGNSIGGQIASSPKVENFPTQMSISGIELADKMYDQATNLGVEFEFAMVTKIEDNGKTKIVKTDFGDSFETKAVILATGASPRKLGVGREEELAGKGIAYCAVCDGDFYAGRPVGVVGGGNTALQNAIYLSKICPKVYIFQNLDHLTGEQKLIDAINETENIEVRLSTTVSRLTGEFKLEIVEVKHEGITENVLCEGLFVSIGQIPHNDPFEEIINLDERGYIKAGEDCKTNVDGIFVAGDARTKSIRQLTTACGDGSVASIMAGSYLV